VEWEGPDAVEECSDAESKPPEASPEPEDSEPPEPEIPSESDISSEDEYISEKEKTKGKSGTLGKVCSNSVVSPLSFDLSIPNDREAHNPSSFTVV
jgi:hypothetical protein